MYSCNLLVLILLHVTIEAHIGSGSFGTCHVRIMGGMQVAVKAFHQKAVKLHHIYQEAYLLQVCFGCAYMSTHH